jgi:hypothetical protein
MNKWKTKVTHINRNENEEKLRRINNGLSKLEKRLNGRQMDFMVRLFRKMNKDYRPNILRTLAKKLDKPRGTVRDCLNKWRRVNDIEKNNDNVKDLRKRLANTKAYNMRKNKTRDALLKSFFKWKNMARNPEDYYPKITNLLDKLTKNIKQKQLKEPFDKIKQARNYTRKGLSLLKNYKKLTDRYNKDHLKNRLNKWRDTVRKGDIHQLKTNIIFRTKNNLAQNKRTQTLSKYFTKWKVYRPKGLDSNFYKGLMLIQKYCQRPYQKDV